MRQEDHALGYLEAIVRYVTAAGGGISGEDIRVALEKAAPQGGALMTTVAQEWIKIGEQRAEQRAEQLAEQREQRGEQRGLRQGLLRGIEMALELRFGLDGLRLLPEITKIADVDVLNAVHKGIRQAETPDALRRLYQFPV